MIGYISRFKEYSCEFILSFVQQHVLANFHKY